MLALIPLAEVVAALASAIGAYFALRLSERGVLDPLFNRWTRQKVVTFEGGKVEFLDSRVAPGNTKAQLRHYLDFEEKVRRALEEAVSESVKTMYLKDRCDFYLNFGTDLIGVEAKTSFNNVPIEYIHRLISADVSRLLLVSQEPFDREFLAKIREDNLSDKVTLISEDDVSSLNSALKVAVEA